MACQNDNETTLCPLIMRHVEVAGWTWKVDEGKIDEKPIQEVEGP